jgi:hypothetical protein
MNVLSWVRTALHSALGLRHRNVEILNVLYSTSFILYQVFAVAHKARTSYLLRYDRLYIYLSELSRMNYTLFSFARLALLRFREDASNV